MIVLDTHVWIWWVHADPSLPSAYFPILSAAGANNIGVSAISLWEVAILAARGRVTLSSPIEQWFDDALAKSGVELLPLTPAIAAESCRLPGSFHRDPADQIIVATARTLDVPLMTADGRIRGYPHVKLLP